MIFVLGGKGFLGSAIVNSCAEQGWEHAAIDVDNYSDYVGSACDLLINADGNSRKFLAREDPLLEFDLSVRSVRASLKDFQHKRYVLFSSADVYPDSSRPETTSEDMPIDPGRQTAYGFHKYLAEQCIRHAAREFLILRLSGFVGPGLRKNPIYDIINGGPLWVDLESELQYLHTRELARMVFELACRTPLPGPVINVGARGVVRLREIVGLVGRPIKVRSGSPRVRCELDLEKLSAYCEIPDSGSTVRAFISASARP